MDEVEAVGFAMWKAEADRAAPNVGKNRTIENYRYDLDPIGRAKWDQIAQSAIAALDAARGKAEPVAWMYERGEERSAGYRKRKNDILRQEDGWTETPLYAHPPADRVAQVVEWQPIETAPTDGTWVQLWGPDGYRGCGCCWRNIDFEDATHWQPIPAGPETGEPFNG